jgi:nitrite reductase (NADH) small subunit
MEARMEKPQAVRLGSVHAIPLGEGRAFVVDGEPIAVFRTRSGGLFATQAFCPHGRGPLADGLIGSATVLCPLHAFAFDLASGRCLSGTCADLSSYAVSLSPEGDIVLQLARRERRAGAAAGAETMKEGTAA